MQANDLTWEQLCLLSQHWRDNPDERSALAGAFDATESYLGRMLRFFRSFEEKRSVAMSAISNPAPDPTALQTIPTVPAFHSQVLNQVATQIPNFPPSPSPLWTDHITLQCENAIVIADVELPDYNAGLMRLVVAMAIRHDIKTLIIGGDYWAFDSITPWPSVFKKDVGLLRDHLSMGDTVIQKAREWFSEVYAVLGNHDRRFSKLLAGQLGPYEIMNPAYRPTVKPYAHLYLETSRGRIMVVHPKNYSRVQLAVPTKLIASEPRRCHIISTHTHHCSQGFDPSGKWQIAEIGCIRDPDRTQYKQETKTTHPNWVQGFAMIRRGLIRTFPKLATDWEHELGSELYAAAKAPAGMVA